MIKAILFDFDGVFVDSLEIGYSYMSRSYELSREDYLELFMGNFREEYAKRDFSPRQPPLPSDYQTMVADQKAKLPIKKGFGTVLSQLSVEYMMGIVSSTRESGLLERLDKHQLTDLFVEVMGKETDKSKVKKFQLFLDRYELSGSDCLFVTDTAGDISEAQQVGISTVGVTRGFHDRKRLEAAEPDWLIDTPAELLEVSVLFTR